MKKSLITLFIFAVVIIAISLLGKNEKAPEVMIAEENAVVVGDQIPGEDVTVHYAKLKESGYVTIYKTTSAGVKEAVGVSQYLPAGEYFNLVINITNPTVSSDTVSAEIIVDDGDENYDPEVDSVVVDEVTNEPVSGEAMIDENATEEIDLAEEAMEDGYTVVVEAEEMDESNDEVDESEDENLDEEMDESEDPVNDPEMDESVEPSDEPEEEVVVEEETL